MLLDKNDIKDFKLKDKYYFRKASPKTNYWFDFRKSLIEDLKKKNGDEFYLVIYGNYDDVLSDYYALPYSEVKELFDENHKDENSERWIGSIINNKLIIKGSKLDISKYYKNNVSYKEFIKFLLLRPVAGDVTPVESEATLLPEGAKTSISVNKYERNPEARRKCIQHYGTKCQVCGFDFKDKYGEIGEGFIEVHHKKLISKIGQSYEVDPINDLIPVCSNCHSILHRNKKQTLSIDELKKNIKS